MAKDYIDEEEMEQNDQNEDISEQNDQPDQPEREVSKSQEPRKEAKKEIITEKTTSVHKKKKHKKKRFASAESSKIPDRKPEKNSSTLYWIIGIILLVIAAVIIYVTLNKGNDDGNGGGNNVTWNGKSLVITEYADFQCPFCKAAFPIVQKLKGYYGNKITIEYKHFLISGHVNAEIAAEASECARDQGKFDAYHNVLFTKGEGDGTGLDKDSLKKYAKDMGLDTTKFNSCLDSGDKKTVVSKDQKEGSDRGVQGTPTFFIGNEKLVGAQLEAMVPVIDKALGENSTIIQDMYKNEPDVVLTVVNDAKCTTCDASRISTVLRQFFPKMTIETVDISSTKGKEIITQYKLEKVPSFVLTKNIEEATKYKENPNLQTAFVQTADGYKIVDAATGATRFIDPEKQKEQDAALAAKAKLAKEKLDIGDKPQVDFFIMAYCPYGNQAEEAVEKVWKILGDKAEFKEHFVIYSNYNGGGDQYCLDKESKYCSMHGIQELNQNIRERCVQDNDGTAKMFAFMLAMNTGCTAQNADTCWTAVAEKAGLDTDAIAKCEKDKGLEIVKTESELNSLLSVSGSPTLFLNGEPYEGGRTPEAILAAVCATFEDKPTECDKVPEPVATPAAPAGNCG